MSNSQRRLIVSGRIKVQIEIVRTLLSFGGRFGSGNWPTFGAIFISLTLHLQYKSHTSHHIFPAVLGLGCELQTVLQDVLDVNQMDQVVFSVGRGFVTFSDRVRTNDACQRFQHLSAMIVKFQSSAQSDPFLQTLDDQCYSRTALLFPVA